MKKLFAVASTALLLVTLTGCAGSSSSSPTYTPDPNPTYTPDPEPTYSNDELFVAQVRSKFYSYSADNSDSEIISLGHQVCTYFDNGGTFDGLFYELYDADPYADEDKFGFYGWFIGSSVAYYCPEYSYLVNS